MDSMASPGTGAGLTERGFTEDTQDGGVSAHQAQTRRLVRAMMALTGRTASGLARAAGLTPSTVNRFMHRPVRHTLSQRTMLALMTETFVAIARAAPQPLDRAALAAIAPAIAVYEGGIRERAPEAAPALARARSALGSGGERRSGTDAPPAPGQTDLAQADLAVVLATTRGVDVQAGDMARAPLRTRRPPFLESDPLAFALLMPDETMTPRFDAGDMLYVSPARGLDAAKGARIDVVLERAGGGFAVGVLVGRSGGTVRLATLSPRTRETHARGKIRGVYRIVGVQRLGT